MQMLTESGENGIFEEKEKEKERIGGVNTR